MKVTTSELLNYVRCYRYAALDKNNRMNDNADNKEFNHYESNCDTSTGPEDFLEPEETIAKTWNRELRQREFHEYLKYLKNRIRQLGKQPEVGKSYTYLFKEGIELVARPDYEAVHDSRMEIYLAYRATKKRLLEATYNYKGQKHTYFTLNDGVYRFLTEDQAREKSKEYSYHFQKLVARNEESGRIIYDAAFNLFTMRRADAAKKIKVYVALVDSDFSKSEKSDDAGIVALFDLTDLAGKMQVEIETQLYRMINHIELNDDSRCLLVKEECQKGGSFECPYVDFCFSHVPKKNSVFNYFQQHLGFREGMHRTDKFHSTYDLVNEGIVDMLDVPISWLQRETNLMQRYCVENDYMYLNKKKIRDKLDRLIYPLYYLDFESYPSMLPLYPGDHPYTQSLFQYSIHVQDNPGQPLAKIRHHEFLFPDLEDHRRELLDSLLDAIPRGDSSIIVYNMSFEDNRLKELEKLFPDKSAHINNLRERLFDLLKVLKNDYRFYLQLGYDKEKAQSYNFYHPDLSGSYSLKKVLPAFIDDPYVKLRVQNGTMAYTAFVRYTEAPPSERQQLRKDLLEYCSQDTMSMAIILEKLIGLVKK